MKIAFATTKNLPALPPGDSLALALLRRAGYRCETLFWDAPLPAAPEPDIVVIRSTWNYHLAPARFAGWLTELERQGTLVFNAPRLLRWNMRKTYLRELATRSIPVVPTLFLSEWNPRQVEHFLREHNSPQAVIKPVISASAHKTFLLEEVAHERPGTPAFGEEEWLLQPFMPEIAQGEWSLMFFNGRYSHAVQKRPKPSEFRVQKEFGGTVSAETPSAGIIEQAQGALSVLPELPLYARVDGILRDGVFILMELELIEPELFMDAVPGSAKRFVSAILERLDREP